MDETTPSKRRRIEPNSLSDRLRVAIDRLTDPELQVFERQVDRGLVNSVTGQSADETSLTEAALVPISHIDPEEA